MSYKNILDSTADKVERLIIEETNNAFLIPTKDYGWENKRYVSEAFRIAHIERYSDRALEVLHITCFPNITCGNPIFGFDIVTTDKKVLAAFLDYSPIINDFQLKESKVSFGVNYPLPDWAKLIFSDKVVAVIPQNDDDLKNLIEYTLDSFQYYLKSLSGEIVRDINEIKTIAEKQNFYSEQQQKNERTFNVLKAKLGEEQAKEFMETILFPKYYITL